MATAATVRCEARAGEGAGHTVAHRISPCLPGREMGAGGGCRQRAYGYPPAAGAGGAGLPAESVCLTGRKARARDASEKLDGWSVGDRGGGTSSPSPSAPPPVAISPRSSTWGDPGEKPGTVSHRLHPGYGFPPAPPRIRFPAGSTPDTVSHQLHPRYDFPPAPPRARLLT